MSKSEALLSPQAAMRKSYSRCGWATLAVVLFSTLTTLSLQLIANAFQEGAVLNESPYFLLFNEAIIGISILVGLLVLQGTKAEAPERRRMPFAFYFGIFSVCVAVSVLGNAVGILWTAPLDLALGNGPSNQLSQLLSGQQAWQLILCVGILAPVFEEFFFRKLLIDRLRPHGEFLAILSSGFLFGLFHQNIGQYFYTFGVGILLAYLYLRTGSYLAVTLMHAAFNLLLGVLPTLVLAKTEEFFRLMENGITEELLEALPALLATYALPLLGYGLQLLLVGILTPTGILIFAFFAKKAKVAPPPATLSVWDMGTNAYINGGMLTSVILLLIATASSLLFR